MARVKVHFDGWVALPETFRRQLGLTTGAELEAELVGGAVVLRPRAGAKRTGAAPREMPPLVTPEAGDDSVVTPEPGASTPEPTGATSPTAAPAESAMPARRKPGRKAKVAGEGAPAENDTSKVAEGRAKLEAALAPVRRTRGRKAGGTTGSGALPT